MVDYQSPALQAPRRKPLPTGNAGLQFQVSNIQHTLFPREHSLPANQYQSHPASSSSSSSFLPTPMHPLRQMTPVYPPQQQQHQQQYNVLLPSRRPSNATTSTSSTGGNPHTGRHMSASQNNVSRSPSSRTTHPQVGYVALMRRQKATVWCDRTQAEDPREAHQRRVAKQRAILEVQEGGGSGRTNTLASSGKIRHSSATKSLPFSTGTMVGTGVPLRLSANEIGNADDDLDNPDGSAYHRRNGSGRSSAASNRMTGGYRPNQPRLSSGSGSGSGSTPPNAEPPEQRLDIPHIVETPAAETKPGSPKDKDTGGTQDSSTSDNRPSTAQSTESQREEDFGMITDLAAPSGAAAAARRHKAAEELRRRGSVDDRTSTMSSVRLFVANPDLSD
ncbi:uncharacterized protein CIMG_06588 [Coccidioides immitis RS]|uniref:Uncharacterized protein n=1 Tax=Coccidioides immitis (strain RS) TaxID=246410 RepID=J3K8G5_COCIM|nr:uncharacterized protein CIMG_06588 [Coccidioides immitis RS]EAS31109.3 hypothetical protein CIMG_06588 [Coccidioides immitis RS]TPX23961.1 hypothetical protein DIZ76_013304 [Coccidioides immitis]